jgi:hypothetical protein
MPTEKPILFSGPMVKAIMEGRKTMTRRVVKPQPYIEKRCGYDAWRWDHGPGGSYTTWKTSLDPLAFVGMACERRPCPYGRVGDRLWVRENWSPDHAAFYPNFQVVYQAEGYDPREVSSRGKVLPFAISPEESTNRKFPFRWRPSIHMPRRVCRIVLEITDVRVERLQGITEEDATAEGIDDLWLVQHQVGPPRKREFWYLWDSLNGPRGFGWDVNPWVWVISFKRV